MKNTNELGIKLLGGITAGIASITVFNITTGKYIGSDGLSYDSVQTRTFDCYCSPNLSASETVLMYWISIVYGNEYDITVSGSGTKNPASTGYDISLLEYILKEPWIDGTVDTTLRFWHTDFLSSYYDFTPVAGTTLKIEMIELLGTDGITTTFALPTMKHAKEFLGVSIDNGMSYLSPWDTSLTWGSNHPDYDNELLDSTYSGFSINFSEPPPVGNIKIKYTPLINTYKVMKVMKLPQSISNSSIISTSSNVRELDWSCEIV